MVINTLILFTQRVVTAIAYHCPFVKRLYLFIIMHTLTDIDVMREIETKKAMNATTIDSLPVYEPYPFDSRLIALSEN